MTNEDKIFLDRITEFANETMADIDPDPTKTPISEQLERLRPIMETLAAESGDALEDVFIRYMDLASEAAVEKNQKLKADYADFDFK
ncbi:MAG: hypothetical protein IJ429_04765 [Lachnospiraceae bacterium]|nr:hypothetical protein [Lachnospiraceae bacterium]